MLFGGPSVVELVERWQPDRWYRHEKRFEKDLAGFLREHLPDTHVRTQGRLRVDIQVGDQVAIELKRKLTTTKARRLVGQIKDYSHEFSTVLAVVCGADDNAWTDFERLTQEFDGGFGPARLHRIRKRRGGNANERTGSEGDLFGVGGSSEGLFGFG